MPSLFHPVSWLRHSAHSHHHPLPLLACPFLHLHGTHGIFQHKQRWVVALQPLIHSEPRKHRKENRSLMHTARWCDLLPLCAVSPIDRRASSTSCVSHPIEIETATVGVNGSSNVNDLWSPDSSKKSQSNSPLPVRKLLKHENIWMKRIISLLYPLLQHLLSFDISLKIHRHSKQPWS